MKEKAATHGLVGTHHPTVGEALQAARTDASTDDFIFIGGSCFIVADLLQEMR
jgi:dihydrofolate synthase/folylpolyglutamate synthase